MLLSTSGSTGSPKLVRLTDANLASNAHAIAGFLGLDEAERPVTTLSMAYSYGLSVVNSHLAVGATLLLTDEPLTSRAFWDLATSATPTSSASLAVRPPCSTSCSRGGRRCCGTLLTWRCAPAPW